MSLRTGAELITYLQIINKASGFFGLLALFTGARIDGWQLSMYIYSALALVATVVLSRHIRLQSHFEALLLAHLYALDSVINALYTAFFGLAWFLTLTHHPASPSAALSPGLTENAGFTSPAHNVSRVDVVAEPVSGSLRPGQNAIAVGQPGQPAGAGLGNAVFESGSIMSISLISAFWALRVYFVFVMLAFARQCLRHHIAATAASSAWYTSPTLSTSAADLAENPFATGKNDGHGWRGHLGRLMLSGAPKYWLGADEGDDWMRGVDGKFRQASALDHPVGFNERERRRRSGTGPPVPQLTLTPLAPKLPR